MLTKPQPAAASVKIADTSQIAVVVYGQPEGDKPRAGLFKPSQGALATKAASLMKLNVFRVETTAHLAAVEKLPMGRLYANGRGFVPYVRRDLYDKVVDLGRRSSASPDVEVSTSSSNPAAEDGTVASKTGKPLPATWEDVGPESLVLAQASVEDGWWEAIVISRTIADVLTLKWRDYPKFKPFTRHVATIGLINPAS
jgi:hypothetical protein